MLTKKFEIVLIEFENRVFFSEKTKHRCLMFAGTLHSKFVL